MHQAYTYLAKYYDLLVPERWYSTWARFARIQIQRAKINPILIVDLACGTGRLTSKLNHIAPTIGIDDSPAMLRVARRNYPSINFIVGSFTTFMLSHQQKADVITCSFDSLNYLPTEKDFLAALSRCVSQLAPNGLLLFDVNGERAFATKGKETNSRTYIFNDAKLVWKNTFYSQLWNVEFEVHTKNSHGKPVTYYEKHTERYYSPQLIIKMLKSLGVCVLGVYSDAAMHHISPKNKRYFFVAQKVNR